MDFDTQWCPSCDRRIEPKRTVVHSAPTLSPRQKLNAAKRTPGLVRGTGSTLKSEVPKKRTVIDQGPTPLYCSDECRLADLHVGQVAPDYNPHRHSPQHHPVSPDLTGESESMQVLAKLYNFGPLPPPVQREPAPCPATPPPLTSGVMMANKFLNEMADTAKPPPCSDSRFPEPRPPKKIVPGWNDGTHAWRAVAYSCSSQSSIGSSSYSSYSSSSYSWTSSSAPSNRSETELLMNKYSSSFSRRAESALSGTCPNPESPPKRDRPLVPSAAEGKLLVPDVMKLNSRNSRSSSSICSIASAPATSSFRPSMRSPLSTTSDESPDSPLSDVFDDEVLTMEPITMKQFPKRPSAEVRSWSYDNISMPTYPIMPFPQGFTGSSKKLFLFPGKPT